MKYRITPCFSDIFSKYQEENEVVHIVQEKGFESDPAGPFCAADCGTKL